MQWLVWVSFSDKAGVAENSSNILLHDMTKRFFQARQHSLVNRLCRCRSPETTLQSELLTKSPPKLPRESIPALVVSVVQTIDNTIKYGWWKQIWVAEVGTFYEVAEVKKRVDPTQSGDMSVARFACPRWLKEGVFVFLIAETAKRIVFHVAGWFVTKIATKRVLLNLLWNCFSRWRSWLVRG